MSKNLESKAFEMPKVKKKQALSEPLSVPELTQRIIEEIIRGQSDDEIMESLGCKQADIKAVFTPENDKYIREQQDYLYERARQSIKASVPTAVKALRKLASTNYLAATQLLILNNVNPDHYYNRDNEDDINSSDDIVKLLKTLPKTLLEKALLEKE